MPRSGPGPVTSLAGHGHLALVGGLEAGNGVEHRRFAAAGWPKQTDELATCDLEGDAVDGDHLSLRGIEDDAEAVDIDLRWAGGRIVAVPR